VVLEDLRSQFTVFGEALQGTRQEMSRRFEHVQSELAVVKKDQDLMKADLQLVKSVVLEHGRDLKAMRASIEKKPDQEEVVAIVREMIAEHTQP
jgi:hypothetical protein